MLFFSEAGDRVSINGADWSDAVHRYDGETNSLILRPLVAYERERGRVVWLDVFGNVLVDTDAQIVSIR